MLAPSFSTARHVARVVVARSAICWYSVTCFFKSADVIDVRHARASYSLELHALDGLLFVVDFWSCADLFEQSFTLSMKVLHSDVFLIFRSLPSRR
jgi:hypothetical protein